MSIQVHLLLKRDIFRPSLVAFINSAFIITQHMGCLNIFHHEDEPDFCYHVCHKTTCRSTTECHILYHSLVANINMLIQYMITFTLLRKSILLVPISSIGLLNLERCSPKIPKLLTYSVVTTSLSLVCSLFLPQYQFNEYNFQF